MGKGTDRLYVTHSEWSSGDAFSASSGKSKTSSTSFTRLPYNYCALSLKPFSHPVCTAEGTIFDLTNILPWLKKHGTNPVDGKPLKSAELIKLNFSKNEGGEYVDPVTCKPFTENTHIVALRTSGNVFSWDTIDRLNVKAKLWVDLVSDVQFTRKDIITLQDPQNIGLQDLASFKYVKDGTSALTEDEKRERADTNKNVSLSALGSSAKILRAREAVARARAERSGVGRPQHTSEERRSSFDNANSHKEKRRPVSTLSAPAKGPPGDNAAQHTTGQAAASFTSTGLTPYTSNERALLSDEEYMLKARRVKEKGYARIVTSQGDLNIELYTEFAPRAVWNFVNLAKKGYYSNVAFHRNIPNFMLQGGDPTGTGRGGQSIWDKPFVDEFAQSPLLHNKRGVVSMANKGKNTNTSQFFITYRAAPHLDRKHTIFGQVMDLTPEGNGSLVLKNLESAKTDASDKPDNCFIDDIVVYVDPFEEFSKNKKATEANEQDQTDVVTAHGAENENMTWTGRAVGERRGETEAGGDGVGRYLKVSAGGSPHADGIVDKVEPWDENLEEPKSKKRKTGGFGNFDNW